MNKVWLVVSGEYSDYRVSCAFTSEDLALAYAAALNGITVDEQREILKAEDLPYGLYTHAMASLPSHEYGVESYDFYDYVPVVDDKYRWQSRRSS